MASAGLLYGTRSADSDRQSNGDSPGDRQELTIGSDGAGTISSGDRSGFGGRSRGGPDHRCRGVAAPGPANPPQPGPCGDRDPSHAGRGPLFPPRVHCGRFNRRARGIHSPCYPEESPGFDGHTGFSRGPVGASSGSPEGSAACLCLCLCRGDPAALCGPPAGPGDSRTKPADLREDGGGGAPHGGFKRVARLHRVYLPVAGAFPADGPRACRFPGDDRPVRFDPRCFPAGRGGPGVAPKRPGLRGWMVASVGG
ncbi:hypothetical protein HRbin22_01941 [Candidatus Thermoflexus japonica]|uniref:Uncharacterized protein n=1 Tax=Candidatus Thermoflexus japonica TaxID=2035417 RepID=A0A2H5Y8E7_9CHLR|nr:hypothetical protein HRbin22_01941 [Candidatus Thermoflexus japonica]